MTRTVPFYFLGGQSNMAGFGNVDELPPPLRAPLPRVAMFCGNPAPDGSADGGTGHWQALGPGLGYGFRADATRTYPSAHFGPELSFGHRLHELHPARGAALLKYARGGSGIDGAAARFGHWHPDGTAGIAQPNQFGHFLRALREALEAPVLAGESIELAPAGIFWMQGESDAAYTMEVAARYRQNLERVMQGVRAALGSATLPIVLGLVTDARLGKPSAHWPHAMTVRAAQADFASTDPHATLISATDGYGYADRFHFDSAAMLDLGRRAADLLAQGEDPR